MNDFEVYHGYVIHTDIDGFDLYLAGDYVTTFDSIEECRDYIDEQQEIEEE